jgi:phosphatidylglycerol lysyltransferase
MKKIYKIAGALLGVVLFAAAAVILHRELSRYSYHEIITQFSTIPSGRLALAALNYVVLTGYDFLAFRYIGNRLEYAKIALASFIACAYSNNIGMAALSGGSIRYRFYTAWGLSAVEIAQVIIFGITTFWIGLLSVGAIAFLFGQVQVPPSLGLPFSSAQPAGILFAFIITSYLCAAYLRKKPFVAKGLSMRLPRPGLVFSQVALSSFDWLLAAGVLYCLLPPDTGFGYARFLAVFMLAQLTGLLSQIPGGLGVFETVIIVSTGGKLGGTAVMAALMAYRVIYYLMPLAAASLLLTAHEIHLRGKWVRKGVWFWGRFAPGFVPQVMAMLTFAGGVVLLFSGAVPAAHGKLDLLGDFLPLGVIEASHFLASLGGAALIILARGLQLRLDASYQAAMALLIAGAALSLTKGLDYDEAIVLSGMAAALWSCRHAFYQGLADRRNLLP